jgi:hypothetical protein
VRGSLSPTSFSAFRRRLSCRCRLSLDQGIKFARRSSVPPHEKWGFGLV